MTAALYDVPGPVAMRRYRLMNAAALVVVIAAICWVIYQFARSGQFDAQRWEQFQYKSIQWQLIGGLLKTLQAACIAAPLAIAFGIVLAVARISDRGWLRRPSGVIVDLCRATPMLILMFFFYYGSLQYNLGISPMWAVIFGLTLYNGAVLAEVFRAGIQAVPIGQQQAAYAIGMHKRQVVRLVLLPQGVRTMLPAIVSQLVILLKDTSLGSIISFNEFLYVARQMGGRAEFGFPAVPSYLVVGAVYVGICGLLIVLANRLERWSRRSKRNPEPAAAAAGARLPARL
jgi:glutamate transport system permease protein